MSGDLSEEKGLLTVSNMFFTVTPNYVEDLTELYISIIGILKSRPLPLSVIFVLFA